MIDNKKENKESTALSPTETSPGAAQDTSKSSIQPPMSKGEKLYNWTVYSGINYWVNLISSIIIADYFTYEKSSGRKHLDSVIEKTAKGLSATGTLSLKKAYHHSRVGLETLALMSGGWLLLVPMKLMEDRKRPVVHWLNKKLGVDQKGPDGRELNSEQIYIEQEQPKQTWLNVFKRRVMATAAVVGTGMTLDHVAANKNVARNKEYRINGDVIRETGHLGGKERTTEAVLGGINKALTYVPGGERVINSARAQRWMGLTILDSVFTKITAVVMHATNGAGQKHMPQEVGNGHAPVTEDELKKYVDVADQPAKTFTGQMSGKDRSISALAAKKPEDNFVGNLQKQPVGGPELGAGA